MLRARRERSHGTCRFDMCAKRSPVLSTEARTGSLDSEAKRGFKRHQIDPSSDVDYRTDGYVVARRSVNTTAYRKAAR